MTEPHFPKAINELNDPNKTQSIAVQSLNQLMDSQMKESNSCNDQQHVLSQNQQTGFTINDFTNQQIPNQEAALSNKTILKTSDIVEEELASLQKQVQEKEHDDTQKNCIENANFVADENEQIQDSNDVNGEVNSSDEVQKHHQINPSSHQDEENIKISEDEWDDDYDDDDDDDNELIETPSNRLPPKNGLSLEKLASGEARLDPQTGEFEINAAYEHSKTSEFTPISFSDNANELVEEKENILHGNGASRGIAFGRIVFLNRKATTSDRYTIEDVDSEIARFEDARNEAIGQLGSLYETTVEKLGEQNAVVFQIHQMMLDDPDYVDAIEQCIKDEKVNAEYAVEQTAQRFAEMFSKMDNDYMQGRASDVIDVSRRLNSILNIKTGNVQQSNLNKEKEPFILASDDLAPSETVQLDQNLVQAILTSAGSSRSHTVIFARTLGLPAVINIGNKLTPDLEGKIAVVDGGAGIVIIDPDEETLATYKERKRTEDMLRARLEQFRGKKTTTLSGRRINLFANIGAVSDVDLVRTSDAEGIGLFRSEYIYLSSSNYPDEETQFAIYKETLEGMHGKKVVIRTLDIGADKTADYFMLKPEENPAMGMRAIRICLTRPEVFKTQLRALYRASAFGKLAIMFPMISSVEEVKECIKICNEVKAELDQRGQAYSDNVELGIMIETPASAVISDLLAEYVDFFSIGTNDLTQFTLAVDRQNAEVGRFLNPYHRAVIRLIEMTVNNAHKNGIWVGVCGELAADEGFTHELVRMGVDEISVVPSSILMLRARISTLG